MPFRIRKKLFIAFLGVLFPVFILTDIVSLYSTHEIHEAVDTVKAVAMRMDALGALQLGMATMIMPANDYIITGSRKYVDEFHKKSADMEERIREVEGTLTGLEQIGVPSAVEKMKMMASLKEAWRHIQEDSQRIFALSNPIGSRDAASMMENMDYRWAYPAIEILKKWHKMDAKEYREAEDAADAAHKRSWVLMAIDFLLVAILGTTFSLLYSRWFVRPIETMHEQADTIALGDFRARVNIKTGDEIEQLADAMNEMAAQLDSLTSNLQGMVEERTLELKESKTRFRSIIETAKDAMICIDESGIIYQWNKSAEDMFGWAAEEVIGKGIHSLIVPERLREKAYEGFKTFYASGTGAIVGKTIEIVGLKKDGAEFPVELSISAMNVKDKWHAVGIIRDITERKKAEEKIKEQLDFLERFQKVAVKREFRIKELRDRVKELEGKAKG